MTDQKDPFDLLLNREEAHAKAASETDPLVRAIMKQTLHTAHRLLVPTGEGTPHGPAAPFDVSFLVEVAREMGRHREILQRFLDGNLTDDFGDPL